MIEMQQHMKKPKKGRTMTMKKEMKNLIVKKEESKFVEPTKPMGTVNECELKNHVKNGNNDNGKFRRIKRKHTVCRSGECNSAMQ